jgi:cytochrome c-type biogenesis protein CcmE
MESAMKARWPIAIALLVAASGFAVIAAGRIGNNLVYYWSPSDLIRSGDKAYGASIRLGGLVAPGSLIKTTTSNDVQFDVTDLKMTVHVGTHGVPPQMFREGIGVVVEGTMTRDGWFDGSRLMVSHNNEYKAPKNHGNMNAEELIKTTKGVSQ